MNPKSVLLLPFTDENLAVTYFQGLNYGSRCSAELVLQPSMQEQVLGNAQTIIHLQG